MKSSQNRNLKIPDHVQVNQKLIQSLYESEETSKTLLNLLPHIVFRSTLDGSVLSWHNPNSQSKIKLPIKIYELFDNYTKLDWDGWIESIEKNSNNSRNIEIASHTEIENGKYICTLMKPPNSVVGMLIKMDVEFEKDNYQSLNKYDNSWNMLAKDNWNDIIRTPLTTVDLRLQMLHHAIDQSDVQNSKRLVKGIQNKIESMLNQMKTLEFLNLLNYQTYSSFSSIIRITEIENFLNTYASNATCKFGFTIDTFVDAFLIKADSKCFFHLLKCLLDNSHDACNNEMHIKISLLNEERMSYTILVYIRDDGGGVEARNIANIFKAGWCGDLKLSRQSKKLGLGLTYAWQYIKKSNGECCVDSSPGLGTIFAVQLPVKKLNN